MRKIFEHRIKIKIIWWILLACHLLGASFFIPIPNKPWDIHYLFISILVATWGSSIAILNKVNEESQSISIACYLAFLLIGFLIYLVGFYFLIFYISTMLLALFSLIFGWYKYFIKNLVSSHS